MWLGSVLMSCRVCGTFLQARLAADLEEAQSELHAAGERADEAERRATASADVCQALEEQVA